MDNTKSSDPLLSEDPEAQDPEAPQAVWQDDTAEDESLMGQGPQHRKQAAKQRRSRWRTLLFVLTMLSAAIVIVVLYVLLQPSRIAGSAADSTQVQKIKPERDLEVRLHPKEHISRPAEVQRHTWEITRDFRAPDGVVKNMFLINNQFPGPTIEARSGDTIIVEVINHSNESVSMHWHGLYMKGANHMDGPVGINQCAIQPGGKLEYQIPTDKQAGTFWYHAHSETQRADGLYGGLVIHNPEVHEAALHKYDEELLFLVGDWYHLTADKVLAQFKDPYTTDGDEPCPDSLLVNGQGYFECSMAVAAYPVNCSAVQKPWINLDKSLRYRVRVVNVGALTGFNLTIPDAQIDAFQIDGGRLVASYPANSVGILYPAQRVDFVLAWPDHADDDSSKLVVSLDREYFLLVNHALTPDQAFHIGSGKAEDEKSNVTTVVAALDGTEEITTFDLVNVKGIRLSSPLPEPQNFQMIYSVIEIRSHNKFVPQGELNRTTWLPQERPLLMTDRSGWDKNQLVPWTGSEPVWVELTINNIDNQGHPFHLHGFDFYVVGLHSANGGWDYYNPFQPERAPRGGPFNIVDPPSRDTVWVPPFGYAVLRFLADNEGIWTLHCHILWHQATGMMMAFQVMGDEQGLVNSAMGVQADQFCRSQNM